MRLHVLVYLALAITLAACVPTSMPPTAGHLSPAPTAQLTSLPITPATSQPAAPALPDPKADPLAALRYSVSPQILHTAAFTLTVTETVTTTRHFRATPAEGPPPTDEVSNLSLKYTTMSWGTVRLVNPWALRGEQQTRASSKSDTLHTLQINMEALDHSILVVAGNCWLDKPSDEWEDCASQIGVGLDAKAQPQFSMLLLPELQAMHTIPSETVAAYWIEDTTLNGENVQHLHFDPQVDDLHPCLLTPGAMSLLLGLFAGEPVSCEKPDVADVEGEAWVSAENRTLRQIRLRVAWSGGSDTGTEILFASDRTLNFAEINIPIQIGPPVTPTSATSQY